MPRFASITTVALIFIAVIAVNGCSGPTKKGIEARSDATDRVNLVNAQVSFDQARRSFETGDLDRALREINNAITRYEDVAEYHLLKGRVLLEMHRLEASMRSFSEAISHDPDYSEAHYFAGIINQRWSRHDEAYASYHRASELEPENVQYLLASGESLIALGRYSDARELITPRLAYHEHNAALRHLLGHIAMLEDDLDSAVTLLQEARLLKPDDWSLLEELARVRFDAGHYSACYETVQELYRSDSASRQRDDLRHLEARALARMERYIDARRAYIDLAQSSPGEVDVWIELASIALELGDERRLDQGSARAMSIAPGRHEGYLLRAMYERGRGNLDHAERLFDQAIERVGENHTGATHLSYLFLGRMFEGQGRFDEARNAYASALLIQPNSPEARLLLNHVDSRGVLTTVTE